MTSACGGTRLGKQGFAVTSACSGTMLSATRTMVCSSCSSCWSSPPASELGTGWGYLIRRCQDLLLHRDFIDVRR